jgi:hypothetical protein
MAAMGFMTLIFGLSDINHLLVVWVFISIVSSFHLILGIGILYRRKWGLMVFKGYLYLLYIGFPLGTYLAYVTLKYIKENRLDGSFK